MGEMQIAWTWREEDDVIIKSYKYEEEDEILAVDGSDFAGGMHVGVRGGGEGKVCDKNGVGESSAVQDIAGRS